MKGRVPTFYDILAVNRHFNCAAKCKIPRACYNHGVQDVNNCNKCICPLGWAGDIGDQRPNGKEIAVETDPKTMKFDMTKKGEHKVEYYQFKVQVTPTILNTRRTKKCDLMGIAFKFPNDKRPDGFRMCYSGVQPTLTSETNEMLVQAYTQGEQFTVELEYMAVN